jgi:hypothetical protein
MCMRGKPGNLYNVTTDHGFPFFMYSAQQDSGTIATPIFGRGGQITYRDWYTTNGFETAHIIQHPTDQDIDIGASGAGRDVTYH